ncbi:MAG: hypothetical protein AB1425_13905 [Actinomycetota bacterium]
MNKTKIALKLLQNRHVRHAAVRALRNEKIRKVIVKQVARRVFK